jgi:2-keto-3-deoxy-L-rhamnonate aldolase RhmA
MEEMLGMESLKDKLKRNRLSIGSWITLAHPAIAEIMADAGFEWLVVDMEHSVITIREAEELIRIISLKNVTPLVRLTCLDPNQIKRVMDAGAAGVIVPMVKNVEEAKIAVQAVKYPPVGIRSVGLARAQGYGTRFDEYAESVNEKSIVIIQIEHIEAINNLEAILRVDGVDGTIIGPYDLSGSMGKPGRFEEWDVLEKLKEYEDISKRFHKSLGYHVVQPDCTSVMSKIKADYTFIAFSVDHLFMGHTIRTGLAEIQNHLHGKAEENKHQPIETVENGLLNSN